MLSSEILSKVKDIELKSKKLVNDVFSGKYHSIFKGQGLEFSEVREYVPGDDIRRIDWNLYSRFEKYFLKLFTDERQMQVQIFVDVSASMGKALSVSPTLPPLARRLL